MFSKEKSITDEDADQVVERCGKLWENFRGARIFISGGTGFFGCWLLHTFIHANRRHGLQAKMVVLSRKPHEFKKRHAGLAMSEGISLQEGEITAFDFPAGDFTHVIHAASELSRPDIPNPSNLLESTRVGCQRMIEFAAQRGVRSFLYTSSGAVYPRKGLGELLSEEKIDHPGRLRNGCEAYAAAKKLGERICLEGASGKGISVKIARGFAFFGPYLPLESHFAAASFMRSALRNERITINGPGQSVRSYLYGADLAQWLWTILVLGVHSRPYNVGSDVPMTIRSLAESIQKACGSQAGVEGSQNQPLDEEPEFYVPNIQRAQGEFGLRVFTAFDQGLLRTVRHHRGV